MKLKTKQKNREKSVKQKAGSLKRLINTVVVITRMCLCNKMIQNYTHTLYQCQFPGFNIVL